MLDHRVTLLVNGKAHGGWKSVAITRSLENAAAGFQVSVSERFPGQNQPLRIRPGDSCQVRIGEDVVVTGYVDRVSPSHDSQSHTVVVAGRSKTADLVDCAVQPPFGTINDQTILQVANRLAEPYGVDIVDALRGKTEPIASYDLNVGDTVLTAISNLAAQKACMVTDDEQGRLLITRAGIARATTALRTGEGGNILSAQGTFDHSGRFRQYICSGQKKGNDQDFGSAASAIESRVEDRGVERPRTLYIRAEGAADGKRVQDRARWECSSRIGKSVNAQVTVQGWRQGNGDLWKINQLVLVKDPLLTIDGELLIVSVNFTLNESGTLTRLTLAPKAAYELLPDDPSPTKNIGVYSLEQLVGSEAQP